MGLRIQTNELAVSAQRNLGIQNKKLQKTIQRLSSGSRIVAAEDDPAGLALSDALNAQVRSLGAAIRNANDGISLVQVFEGGTNELNNMLIRIRELAMQSSSDTVGDRERSLLDNEVQELKKEIDRVAKTTQFGGRQLLSGEVTRLDIQVGFGNDDEVDRITFAPGDTNLTADSLEVGDLNILEKENAQESLQVLDEALQKVNDVRARVGAVQNRLQTTVLAQSVFKENLSAARSRIRDADIAEESSNLARETILREAGVAVLAQANQTPALALKLLR